MDSLLYSILNNFDKFWKDDDKKVDKNIIIDNIVKNKRNSIFNVMSQNIDSDDKEEVIIMELFVKEHKSIIKQNKIMNYRNKIINLLKYSFPNMTDMNPIFENGNLNQELLLDRDREIYIGIIINELILSNFDCILTSFLIMDPVMNRYTEKTINIIFQFLLFYTLSKQSLLYFLTGNSINNITKILDLFPLQVLNFLSLIMEGIYLYDIDCHQHEQIPKLLNQIYNFIKKNINMKEEYNDINNIRKCIIYTMDIIYYLSPNIEIENLTSINKLIVEELEKLIDKEKIINMFPFQGLIKKYEYMKNSNIFNDENEEEFQANTDFIILEDKSYLMKYIKKIFDSKIDNNKKFPNIKPNYIRKKYKIIEYKEKEVYDYMISEENKDCTIVEEKEDDDEDNENIIKNIENENNLINNNIDNKNENKIDKDNQQNINDNYNINNDNIENNKNNEDNNQNKKSQNMNDDLNNNNQILKEDEKGKKEEEDNMEGNEEPKINEIKNIIDFNKIEEENEEEEKKNEINENESNEKFEINKRVKTRNMTLAPKMNKTNIKSSNTLNKISSNLENPNNIFNFSNLKNNIFSSKIVFKPGNSPRISLDNNFRKSSHFKSKLP